MRNELKKINNERTTFTGKFVRLGKKSGYKGGQLTTVLLKDIKDESGKILTDHLWFNFTVGFQKLKLIEGDIISFDARVKNYSKGYIVTTESDYKLSHPTNIRMLASKMDRR